MLLLIKRLLRAKLAELLASARRGTLFLQSASVRFARIVVLTECKRPLRVGLVVGSVVLGIVLIGLLILLVWRIAVFIYDRREYARFERERRNARWETVSADTDLIAVRIRRSARVMSTSHTCGLYQVFMSGKSVEIAIHAFFCGHCLILMPIDSPFELATSHMTSSRAYIYSLTRTNVITLIARVFRLLPLLHESSLLV